MGRGLEGDLAPDLPESGLVGCACLAEITIRKVHVDAVVSKAYIVRPVKEIEDLKPELEIYSLCYTRVLVDVDIGLYEVRTAEPVRLLISLDTKGGNGEVAFRNCPRKPRFVVGQLVITERIGVIEPDTVYLAIPVGVVVPASRRIANRRIRERRTWCGRR